MQKNIVLFYCVYLFMKNDFMNFVEWILVNKYILSLVVIDGWRNVVIYVYR